MSMTTESSHRRPLRLVLYTGMTWVSMFWERFRPAIGVALGIAGLFLLVALADVLPLLPGWLHLTLLIVFGVLTLVALVLGLRRMVLPNRDDAERRLELESGLEHRPLQAIRDIPTVNDDHSDPAVGALWRLHQQRARAAVAGLRVVLPRIGVEKRDPVAPQIVLMLALGVMVTVAWGEIPERLERAMAPSFGAVAATVPPAYDLWIDPPSYTRAPPVFLHVADDLGTAGPDGLAPDTNTNAAAAVTVPVKSRVLGRLQGSPRAPELQVGEALLQFEELEPGLFVVESELTEDGALSLTHDGKALGTWRVDVVPDNPPQIAFADPPGRTDRAALRLPYAAEDDYGILSARAVIRLNADEAVMAGAEDGERNEEALEAMRSAESITLDLPVASGGRDSLEGVYYEDLSAHIWAGLPVSVTLEATDAAGQVGRSETVATILPEREFNHPVARLLVEQRRALFLEPDQKGKVVAALFQVNKTPEAYGNDTVVYMTLRSAILRLMRKPDADDIASVQQLLWDTALHIEDGRVSIASRDLRDAQRALQEALSRGADDAEIEELMDQLQEAINRFLDAMEEQMAQLEADDLEDMQPVNPGDMQAVDRSQLQEMLDQARELSRSGAKDAAQEMLSQLQEMLENLQSAPMMAQPNPQNERAMEMMRGLETLMEQQQDLLDRTFREARRRDAERQRMRDMFNPRMPNMTMPGMPRSGQQGQMGRKRQRGEQPGQQSGQGSMGQQQGGQQQGGRAPSATEQEALRRILGELMRNLGEMMGDIPAPLGRAERAMRDAARSLEGNQPGEASGSQTEALDQLQAGAQAMAEQMQQQNQGNQGMGQIPSQDPGSASSQQTDPLGRRLPDSSRGAARGHVDIPSKSEIQRSREILEELHRRAGERARPRLERDYIDRLLERF